MNSITNGLENVEKELHASEDDGPISQVFHWVKFSSILYNMLKQFFRLFDFHFVVVWQMLKEFVASSKSELADVRKIFDDAVKFPMHVTLYVSDFTLSVLL